MAKEKTPAYTIINDVCRVKKNERVLIIANPSTDIFAQDLFTAASGAGGIPVLMIQCEKTAFDNADPAVIAAIAANPDVCLSISAVKLGKDPGAAAHPYRADNGIEYDHIFDYLLSGKKTMRAVWTPGITESMYNRTVQIDYAELRRRCAALQKAYEGAVSVHVTSPAGTDMTVPVQGRKALDDNGDFSVPGTGGNIPSGEVFISPVVGGSSGTIVYDGSMTFGDGDALLRTPITVKVADGFVTDISGGEEARRLRKTVESAEERAFAMEKEGKLPAGTGAVYRRNARNIGELGIGLNPAADITGNMLEDEKAFRTCHFAIGENYDGDAPALIHLDGVVRNPTITITYADGSRKSVLVNGGLQV
jgi:aminopeptidase